MYRTSSNFFIDKTGVRLFVEYDPTIYYYLQKFWSNLKENLLNGGYF